MLAPFALGVVALLLAPAVATFALAFFDYDALSSPQWAGLDNFRELAHDPFVADSMRASLLFVALAVPLRVAVATGAALLLHRRERGAGAARTAVFLPTIVPDAAWALLWMWLLNPVYGPVNAALGGVGLGEPGWYATRGGALAMMVLMAAFTAGEGFVVALAARRELGEDLLEAARLEGASPWTAFRRVTLPLMAPVLTLVACRDLVVSLQATFAATYLITDGGPDRATLFLPVLIYDVAFEQLRYGYGAALTLVTCAFTGVVIAALYAFVRRWRLLEG